MRYYLDIETNVLDPNDYATHEIITIQFKQMYPNGDSQFPLTILKAWESSEKEILEYFFNETEFFENPWMFEPVGYNLKYDFRVLCHRYNKLFGTSYTIDDFLDKPHLDLHSVMILANKGKLKDSGLVNFSSKEPAPASIAELYRNSRYTAIVQYIVQEAIGFFELYRKVLWKFSELHEQHFFDEQCMISEDDEWLDEENDIEEFDEYNSDEDWLNAIVQEVMS